MLIIEQVIALLGAKFPGVRKDGIKNLAGVIALQAENEEEARAIVDKLTADKVSAFVSDYRSNIDREIQQSVSTAEQNLRNKYDFVDKGQQQQQQQQQVQQQNGGITIDQIRTLMAESVKTAMQPFAQRLDAIDAQNVAKVRREAYVGKLKAAKLEDSMIEMMTGQFDMMQFADDNAFNAFMAAQQPSIDKMAQQAVDARLRQDSTPGFASVNKEGVSDVVSKFIAGQNANSLGGKAI